MKRLDFLRSLLGIPAMAVLFPTSPGAAAEPQLTNSSVRAGYLSRNPTIGVYVTYDSWGRACFDLPFEDSTFQTNDIIAHNSNEEQLWIKESWKHENTDTTIHRCIPLVEQPEPLFTKLAPRSKYKSIGSMQTNG